MRNDFEGCERGYNQAKQSSHNNSTPFILNGWLVGLLQVMAIMLHATNK
jgi:hypothetical protein